MNKYKLVETKDIKKIPKILREKSKEITTTSCLLLDLAKQMKKIMKENKGVGISAIQVGVPVRMLVVKNCGQDMIFINPDIIRMSRHEVVYSEGCLSFPEVFREISRPEKIKVKAKNENFEDLEIEAEGLVARTLEHEIDHLNGIVFLDRVGD